MAFRMSQEDGMTFRPKPEFLVISELEQLMRICPTADAFKMVRAWLLTASLCCTRLSMND